MSCVVIATANRSIPVEKLNDSEGGGVRSGSRSNPVKSSLSDVDKIDVFVSLAEGEKKQKSANSSWESTSCMSIHAYINE